MPITFLAHQAPVLPLKRWQPGSDGVALVVGSCMPDLGRATQSRHPIPVIGHTLWWHPHSVGQQFLWCLPVGLALTWLMRRLLAPQLGPYLPDLGRFHLRDLRHLGRTRHRWYVIVGSVLIGTFSHILLDLLTHSDRGVGDLWPGLGDVVGHLGGRPIEGGTVLQVLASIVLSGVTIWQMAVIGRDRLVCRWSGVPAVDPPRPWADGAIRSACVVVFLAAAVVAASRTDPTGLSVVLMDWVWVSLVGLSLVALVVAASHRRTRVVRLGESGSSDPGSGSSSQVPVRPRRPDQP